MPHAEGVETAVSIRSPHRSKGRRFRWLRANSQVLVSIRSPHRSKGRLGLCYRGIWPRCVSIRSPHRSKGRPALPHAEGVETAVSIRSPHRSKGRRFRWLRANSQVLVSIRSPHRSKGRQALLCGAAGTGKFQSAPLTEARGDLAMPTSANAEASFNPLPSPKQGETSDGRLAYGAFHYVSIRSPHRSKGRPTSSSSSSGVYLFQSAPLTEARGDCMVGLGWGALRCFNPLPSPKQGETFLSSPVSSLTDWFQSAPLTEARGDLQVRVLSPS